MRATVIHAEPEIRFFTMPSSRQMNQNRKLHFLPKPCQ